MGRCATKSQMGMITRRHMGKPIDNDFAVTPGAIATFLAVWAVTVTVPAALLWLAWRVL